VNKVQDGADVIIVGGGPAGLTAALYLARFRRKVLVIDAGEPRARLIPASHNCPGFPDGIAGLDLIERLRRQATRYGALIHDGRVENLGACAGSFAVTTTIGLVEARRVVLASGLVDIVPDLPMLRDNIGKAKLRLCPVCDGYEAINQRVAVIGPEERAFGEALFLRDFTPHVAMLCSYPSEISRPIRLQAAAAGVDIMDEVADILVRDAGFGVVLACGRVREIDVIYPAMGCTVRSELALGLGATCDPNGYVRVNEHQETSVPGLYAIGDVVSALNQIAVAFGHAAIAAAAIHRSLREQ
jgi:thioredoxin reductase (NADPH)